MQPTNNINDPNGMDELLKQAFLDMDLSNAEDSKLMDQVAAEVMQKDWPKGSGNSHGSKSDMALNMKTWTWILSGVAGITLSIGAIYMMNKGNNESLANNTTEIIKETEVSEKITNDVKMPEEVNILEEENEMKNSTSNKNNLIPETSFESKKEKKSSAVKDAKNDNIKSNGSSSFGFPIVSSAELNLSLKLAADSALPAVNLPDLKNSKEMNAETNEAKPLLTDEELEKHKKNMEQHFKSYAGKKMDDYAMVIVSNKVQKTKNSFYMKKAEVTIKEYNLFLSDLLAKGKSQDYLKAKPNLDGIWTDPKDKTNRNLLENYFKKEKYELYPVVCISKEGMEMYCKWLQDELHAYYKKNNEKIK